MTETRLIFPRAKLYRPPASTVWIARPRLLERLDQVLEKPVALVSAPAGFGKTTLLSQWLDRCRLPNAWLQLDEDDSELPSFLTGVVAALSQLFPGCLQKTADLLMAQGEVPLAVWKNTLIDDLHPLEMTPFILALDDYHLLGNPSIDLLLSDLLRSEPLPMHLILSARRSPSLSFSRLKVQGRVVEIRTADLRFTDTETLAYLHQSIHAPLSTAVINQLQEKTEGWAAGLALAAISLREETQPEHLIARLDGSDSQVSDYLLDQVYYNQPGDIQEFLLKTATFDQFCAPMLSAVFDSGQSEAQIQALLERIEAAQLFLTPLDTQRSWYRYHHLFRQMLRARQRFYLDPAGIEQARRRAADWLTRQGQLDEALAHLVAVQDWINAAQLVESQLRQLLNSEDYRGIKRRLSYFSEDFIATRPGLLLMQAWVAQFGLRLPAMRAFTATIQAMLDCASQRSELEESGAPLSGFEIISPAIVQAQVWELDSSSYYLVNQGSLALPLARQAVEFLPSNWTFARGNAMAYLGLSMFMQGQYHQAVEKLTQEYERLPEAGKTYGVQLLFSLATIHLLQGELELCRQAAEQMRRSAFAFNLHLMQGWSCYLLGRVYQEWNQLELAAAYYQQVVDQRFTSNQFCALEAVAGYVLLLHTLSRGELAQQSQELLQELQSEQPAAMLPPLVALIAWLNLQGDNREEARRWAESFTAPIAGQAIVWYHIPHIYKAKILMETGRHEPGGAVTQLLDELQALAERTNNNFTLVRVLAMRAVWLARQGKAGSAQQALERALRLGRPGGFIQAFAEQGPPILELLQAASLRLNATAGLGDYLASLIAACSAPRAARPAPAAPSAFKTLLTEREMEVLELLAERLSIQEISARLFISPSTVQQHTHHIYRKLNVANKRQAVTRAIELGMLPARR